MKNIAYAVVAMAALGACDATGGGDGGTGGPGDPGTPVVPIQGEALQVGMLAVADYDGAETLRVQIRLDGTDTLQQYDPDPDNPSIGTYSRFIEQDPDDPDSRFSTAYAARSVNGVQGTVVLVGGQFNRFVGGANVSQTSNYTPGSGTARYTGDYVGLLNFGPPLDASVDPDAPRTATPVSGNVRIDVNFLDDALFGSITGREFGPNGEGTLLADVVLVDGVIAENGSFSGDVELRNLANVGSFSGTFGGLNASSIAGMVELGAGAFAGPTSAIAGATGTEVEYGIFVLDQ